MEAGAALVAVAHQEAGNMKTLAQLFLTEREQQQITETVRTAEKKTSGEIVPMVVSKSGDYPQATIVCALSLSLPISIILAVIVGKMVWIGPDSMWLFLSFFAVTMGVTYLLTQKNDTLRSYFIKQAHVETQVEKSALAAFYGQKLYKTAANNGILLYISVLEKKVWILADSGINEKIEQSTWDSVVKDLASGIQENNQCEAICAAVTRVGDILKEHFPYQKDDEDELHNLIIE